MKQIFESVKEIEKKIGMFFSEDKNVAESLMIENAASALENSILKKYSKKKIEKQSVTILCGSGNNGADGYTLARRLCGKCKLNIVQVLQPKSLFCVNSFNNLKRLFENTTCNLNFFDLRLMQKSTSAKNVIHSTDVVVDCIFGTGFHGNVSKEIQALFEVVNKAKVFRIACDVPSGLDLTGENVSCLSFEEQKKNIFCADLTVTMGSYKSMLFSDVAKDFVGIIKRASIGIDDSVFSSFGAKVFLSERIFLLEKSDANVPVRIEKKSHKGKFGHVCIFGGEKIGAGVLCATAALKIGAGLSSIQLDDLSLPTSFKIPASVMITKDVPQNVNAFVIGPGFGRQNELLDKIQLVKQKNASAVFDADSFYYKELVDFLESITLKNALQDSIKENLNVSNNSTCKIVLTPHPKEFCNLYKLCFNKELSILDVQNNRLELAREFSKKFKNVVLVLKGANTFIAQNGTVYVCTYGTNALSKAGAGDVLAGIIAGLLAQNYSALDAACTGVLMHSLASKEFKKNYALTSEELIEKL